jgi:hypothetical protein
MMRVMTNDPTSPTAAEPAAPPPAGLTDDAFLAR